MEFPSLQYSYILEGFNREWVNRSRNLSASFTNVPPGEYQIEAWHEGWKVVGQGTLYDVMTQVRVQRPVFSEPLEWTKKVTVSPSGTTTVNFVISDRRPELASN